jgi:hypothetical protein
VKLKIEKKEITPEYIKTLQFLDICGVATKEEIKLLESRNIPTYMGGGMKKKMREKYPHYYDPKKMKEYLKKFKK